jgi:hypothetical protein
MTVHVLNQCQAWWALSLSQFRFVMTNHFKHQQGKLDTLFHRSCFMPKEGDATYEQQCDVILKLKHLWLQTLSVTLEDQILIKCIHENLVNNSFTITIWNCSEIFWGKFDKFKFQDELLYHDGLLYVLDDPTWFQVLQDKHVALVVSHFGFNEDHGINVL